MIYQRTGRFDLAVQYWNDVIEHTQELELYGNKAQAHFWLEKLYLHVNNTTMAHSQLKKIEQLYTEEPKSSINNILIQGQLLTSFEQEDFKSSRDLLSQLEKLNNPLTAMYRGDLALFQNKYSAAELHYLDFIQETENTGNYYNLTQGLNRLSQLYIFMKSDKLLSNINKTESYNPPIYPFNIYKAQTAYLMGNNIEAISLLEEVKIKSHELWQQKDQLILDKLRQ